MLHAEHKLKQSKLDLKTTPTTAVSWEVRPLHVGIAHLATGGLSHLGSMTTEHSLQHLPLQNGPRNTVWSEVTLLREKLYHDLAGPNRTVAFMKAT